jgi:hypothetical protein
MEPVLKELGIDQDAAKIAVLRQLQSDLRNEFASSLRDLKGKDRLTQSAEIGRKLQAKYNAKLKQLLTLEQFSRVQQISLQWAGPAALDDADVAQVLGITKVQQQQLLAASRETKSEMRTLFSFGGTSGPPDAKAVQEKLLAMKAEREHKINEILSKTQLEKFAQLKGKPFDVAGFRTLRLPAGETAVVIDIKDPGVQVTLRGEGSPSISITATTGPSRREVPVEPGEHQFTITTFGDQPPRQFTTKDRFSVRKGQKRTFVLSIVDKQLVARLDDQILPLTQSTKKPQEKKN